MKSPLILILTLLLFGACKKSPDVPVDNMWRCHHKENWSAAENFRELLGTWNWEYVECPMTADGGSYDEYEGLSIEFLKDGTYKQRQDNAIIADGSWELINGDGELYAVFTNPYIDQLSGRILFCSDVVEFENSFLDGCDNFFRKQ